ncbi:hypothetical protein D1970_19290 [Mesobacillus zeae]|uniref:Peptidase S8/S53 domain-containing protein n=1 Tax=Mesobacillus zeae TaxID=1917180 RepID=A0A398B081_9BACI|nr:hypothetical protein D1970_19290 [Mesobacillus zeae]
MVSAIEWYIGHRMDIINQSLGVKKDLTGLREICDEATNRGIIIVSSHDENRGLLWPGHYPSVFASASVENGSPDQLYYNKDGEINFKACGLSRHLEGPMQKFNLQGHSFAAAYVTSFIAQLMEMHQEKGYEEVCKLLLKKAS